ncbi:Ig-like domain-containing protein [Clostridiaceae bacterium UIB06]|nr:Ig-like domain-containing protein [Clostridiaceae bacterium UIB06]
MNSIKSKVCLFLCFFLLYFYLPFSTNVKASKIITSTYNSIAHLPDETNVNLKDPLLVTFSEPITLDKLDGLFVEKKSQSVPVLVSVINSKTLSLRPLDMYEENTTYTVKLFMKDNKKYSLDFTTKELPHDGMLNQSQGPVVSSTQIINSETIRVKFDESVKHEFAVNPLNYQLRDEKYNNITSHIKVIKPISDVTTADANTYDIVLYKTAGEAKTNGVLTNALDSEPWNLEQSQCNITIANIPSTGGIVMDKYSFVVGMGSVKNLNITK